MNTIQLPNLDNNPKVIQQTIIGVKSYQFAYSWMNDGFCLLDIKLDDVYIVQGLPMVTGSDLIGRVKNSDQITGSLYLINKYGQKVPPTQENFDTDYYLVWVE